MLIYNCRDNGLLGGRLRDSAYSVLRITVMDLKRDRHGSWRILSETAMAVGMVVLLVVLFFAYHCHVAASFLIYSFP